MGRGWVGLVVVVWGGTGLGSFGGPGRGVQGFWGLRRAQFRLSGTIEMGLAGLPRFFGGLLSRVQEGCALLSPRLEAGLQQLVS